MSFWSELKRRNVVKVGIAYAIVAWLLIQGADIIFPHLNLPSWAVTFLIVFLIIGFPLALLFAWAFEITPDGIKLTKEVPRPESITHLTGQKFNYIVTGLLVVAVAFLAVKVYFIDRRATESEMVYTKTEQASAVSEAVKEKNTIAVLPFVNLSSDPEQEYFVDGLSEELLNTLAQIPDLGVTARTSSFSFKGTTKTVQEIASVLGVKNILEGSVRKAGNALRITAQLVRAADGLHVWSKTYDRELKDIFAVQEDIARAVANELKITLGIGKSAKQLGGTDNPKAYELYLIAKGQLHKSGHFDDMNRALESIDAAIALDPDFALAWAIKADIKNVYIQYVPINRAPLEQDAALSAAQRVIEIEPNLAAGYYSLSYSRLSRCEFIEAEYAYRKAIKLTTESSSSNETEGIPLHYLSVGKFEKSKEILELLQQNDPLNQTPRALYIFDLAVLSDTQQAEDEYKHGRALFGDQWDVANSFITFIRLGAKDIVSSDEIPYSSVISDTAKKYLDSPKGGCVELRRIYTDDDNLSCTDLAEISIWAAYFGDFNFAIDALQKAVRSDGILILNIWYPVMHEVRQLPRFKEFIKEIGLVDYWNEFGWPDLYCRPVGDDDFECD